MLWGDRNNEKLPPELEGKKPEEIAAALKAAKDQEAAFNAEKEARRLSDEKSAGQTTEIDRMKTRMAELEANQKDPLPDPVADPNEPASPWVDPDKWVDGRLKGTAQVAMNAGLMAAKMYFMQNLASRDQKIFKKYEKEVEAVVSTFAPEARVMPQSWLNALLYVKGLHEQEIGKAEKESTDFFSERPTSSGAPPDEPVDKLTAEEEEACQVMHWDPKGYLERKKKGQLSQSSKGSYAKFSV